MKQVTWWFLASRIWCRIHMVVSLLLSKKKYELAVPNRCLKEGISLNWRKGYDIMIEGSLLLHVMLKLKSWRCAKLHYNVCWHKMMIPKTISWTWGRMGKQGNQPEVIPPAFHKQSLCLSGNHMLGQKPSVSAHRKNVYDNYYITIILFS